MSDHEIRRISNEIHEDGEISGDFTSAGWVLFVIGIALFLILRTI